MSEKLNGIAFNKSLMPPDYGTPVESPDHTTIFEYHGLEPPSTSDIYAATRIQRRYLPKTPLEFSESLSSELDAEVYLKREDTLPTGSFKPRGFFTLLTSLSDQFREKGLITASMGSHGLATAYAAREFGIEGTVAVPETLENPGKLAGLERLGAKVEQSGVDFDEACRWAEQKAAEEGYRFIHPGNEPDLIAGRGTAGLEVMEQLPETDIVINPVGGGSSAAAYCLTVGELLGADVIGVQAEGADSVFRAWKGGELEVQDSAETFAEGLSTQTPFWLPLQILREHLDEMVLVPDDQLREGIYDLLDNDSILAEGAAAAGVAAARQLGDELVGKTVVIPVTGRNLSTEKLRDILTDEALR